jgi:stress-induced morphogen
MIPTIRSGGWHITVSEIGYRNNRLNFKEAEDMEETWQVSLKRQLTDSYVQSPQEWTDINISTSGLLNLTIVSERFTGLSMSQRKEQLQSILSQFKIKISPGFISLYFKEQKSMS